MAVYSFEVIRHILIGLGYLAPEIDPNPDPRFAPWKRNNNSLTDNLTKEAITKFQKQYSQKLVVDGNADSETQEVMQDTIKGLQNRLKFHGFATNAEIPSDKPFYGPATYKAVKKFQKSQGLTENGIASVEQRQILQQPTLTPNKPQPQPQTQLKLIDLCLQFQKKPQNPSYIAALNNLQHNLPKDVLHKVTNKWRGTNDQNPELVKLTNVFTYYDDTNPNHRDALNHLQSQITPAIYKEFINLWNKK
jgi:peptidoglycan hydrolase-like protein with peptidoglycan-binding domain